MLVEQALYMARNREHKMRALLGELDETSGFLSEETLRQRRAVAVLQRIGTAKSREVLARIASGMPTAPLTQQAKAALARVR